MPALDYVVILLFAVLVLVAGLTFAGSGNSMRSYFAAGGSMPWWISGLSLFMSFFSAGTFVVWGSIAYEYGWVAITIQWMMAISGFIIALFISDRWKNTGALTVGEYLGNRFGVPLKQFYSYLFLLLSFVTTGAFLYPVARLFNVASGFSVEMSIAIIGLLIIGYTAAGGLWAVVVTDVLQFVILTAGVIIVVPLAFRQVGGPEQFIEAVPEGFFDLTNGEYTAGFLAAFILYNTIFIGGNWAYVQRYTSVSSPKNARRVCWLFGALYLVSPIIWMLPPMIYRELEGGHLIGLEHEGAFLLICKQVLPSGLLGLMLGGMIFATASSVTTTLNMSAAVFTNDIINRFKQHTSEGYLIKVARAATIVLGLLTVGVAFLVPRLGGIVEVVLSVGAITGAPLFAPPIWSLFSKRQTRSSIITATIIGLGINCFFKFLSPVLLNFSLDRAWEMAVGVLTPLVILTISELLLPPKGEIAPVPEEAGNIHVAASGNFLFLKVLGTALIITGLFITIIGVLTTGARVIVMTTGMIVVLPGIWFLVRYRASQRVNSR